MIHVQTLCIKSVLSECSSSKSRFVHPAKVAHPDEIFLNKGTIFLTLRQQSWRGFYCLLIFIEGRKEGIWKQTWVQIPLALDVVGSYPVALLCERQVHYKVSFGPLLPNYLSMALRSTCQSKHIVAAHQRLGLSTSPCRSAQVQQLLQGLLFSALELTSLIRGTLSSFCHTRDSDRTVFILPGQGGSNISLLEHLCLLGVAFLNHRGVKSKHEAGTLTCRSPSNYLALHIPAACPWRNAVQTASFLLHDSR